MCEGLAKAVDVGTRPIRQAIDDTGSGADQGLARCRAGDAPDFTIFFPDHLGTIHGPQRSAHLLPQVTLKRVRPQELGDRDPDTPVELPAKGGLLVKGDLCAPTPRMSGSSVSRSQLSSQSSSNSAAGSWRNSSVTGTA